MKLVLATLLAITLGGAAWAACPPMREIAGHRRGPQVARMCEINSSRVTGRPRPE
jgi:hypothetical protein